MKRTALNENHRTLGAKLIEFAGWEMPVEYKGVKEEHLAVRKRAGLFDLGHMGEIEIRGKEAASFCQHMTSNDVCKIGESQAQYTLLCNTDGGVVDDVIVYKFSDEHLFMCVNAVNAVKDYEWLERNKKGFEVELHDKSPEFSLLALQGPNSEDIMAAAFGEGPKGLKKFYFRVINWDDSHLMIARTGYTGEDGFEIFIPWDRAPEVWNEILENGRRDSVEPCGLGARDTLRIEMGYPLYGHEIDEETNPFEAGLNRFLRVDKGNFIGKEALVRVAETGCQRKLFAFEMIDRGIPRQGHSILKDEVMLGRVTSGTMSPSLEKPIGMAYSRKQLEMGDEIGVEIRGTLRKAEIVSLPFLKKN